MKATYRTILSALLGTASVLASGAGTLARAAEDGEESATAASGLVERGIALRRGGDDAAALPLFQEAERLEPSSTRVMVHLAAVYQALGQWEQADRYLTRALRDPNEAYVHKHQAMLAEARRTVEAHIARLRLTGGPEGTEVRLNGKSIGTLPMTETTRIEAGVYTLEASLAGHYPVTRSIALAGGALAQETVELTPHRKRELAVVRDAEPVVEDGDSHWLAWTLGGLAAASAGGTVFAWAKREQHAELWNDNERCLSTTRTRGQLCGSELDKGERAETWMWIGGAATVVFSGAAIGSLWLDERSDDVAESASVSCGVGLAAVQCAGRF